MATHYETLGIDPSATAAEIDQAYRFLAQKFHPDANPASADLARKRFQVVQEAYETLSDPERRRDYDAKLGVGLSGDWERITMNTDNGGVRFNSDGSLHVAGRRISPDEAVPKTTLGSATIEKDAGPRGEFRVWHGGKQHRFRYANSAWHAFRDKKEAKRTPPPTPDPPRSAPPVSVKARGPTYTPPVEMPRPQSRPKRRMLMAGALLGVGLAGGYFASRAGSNLLALTPEEERAAQATELKVREGQAALNEKLQAQAAVEDHQRQQVALAREKLLSAKRLGDEAIESVGALGKELDLWEQEIVPLLTNEDGKKFASNEQNLRVFKALYEKPKPSRASVAALRLEVETLLEPINSSLAAAVPSDSAAADIGQRLLAKHEEAIQLAAGVRQARESIRNLALVAPGAAPTAVTLERALAMLAFKDAEQQASVIAETERTTREAATDELAKARKALAEAEAERERLAVENQTASLQARTEHDKNLEEAKSAKVQSAIRFFLTKGYYQPGDASDYEKTVEPHPISYSKLLAYGALEPSNEGLARLLFIVTNFPDDRRTRWKMNRYIGSLGPEETERLATAQDYLRRLGDALVELKLLDP